MPILNNNVNAIKLDKHVSFAAPARINYKCGNVVSCVQSVSSLSGSAISSPFAAFSDSATQTSSRLARTLVPMKPYACGHSSNFEAVAVVESDYLSIHSKSSHSNNAHLKMRRVHLWLYPTTSKR